MGKYTIGVDFGTLSVRALVVAVEDGKELGSASFEYPHAVMISSLPDGTPLKPDWALQHPQDYLDGLSTVVREAVQKSGVGLNDVIGLGIDFTSSTSFPVDGEGNLLCTDPLFSSNPYAWPMLWKHHAAKEYADRMTDWALKRGEPFLERCGGRISSEMMFPRLWQIAAEAPEVYAAASRFIEAGDWIVQQLTGCSACSVNPASYKLFWSEEEGYPSQEFFETLDVRIKDILSKVSHQLLPLGSSTGELNENGMALTNLKQGTPVSVTCIDAHTALPAAGVAEGNKLLLILGTSAAHLVLDRNKYHVNGLLCMAKDGMMPGWYAYEAGQSCCGDHFKWFADRFISAEYEIEARNGGMDIQQLLTEKAAQLFPGQSGLLALDWWNGNRSVLMDAELSGMLIGLTLQTKPEEIYRALIEATAYGTRTIIENFEFSGIEIKEVYVCGGIAKKNPLLMQIYADVLKRELRIVRSEQANALGTAIFAAVAAGEKAGGYATIEHATHAMGGTGEAVYRPNGKNSLIYDELYVQYRLLHDCFGRGENNVMHRLKAISAEKTVL